MDLLTYISDFERRSSLAQACNGASPDYLWQIATGRRRASTDLAKLIESESERLGPEKVPKESLRPDVWGDAKAAA